jgi:hypothetical protein
MPRGPLDPRIHTFKKEGETHAEFKVRIRNDSAWNMGLALATSEKQLTLILVRQADYPIHLIQKSANDFLLYFDNINIGLIPGRVLGSSRPSWIGPRYKNLTYWAPVPFAVDWTPSPTLLDCYKLLDDIKHGRSNQFYSPEEIKLSDALIRRKAVVL